MNDLEHGRAILETARRDARALRGMFDSETFPDEIFGFHAQQAVEKALKAWLASLGIRFPKTHDLQQLLDLLTGAEVDTSMSWPIASMRCFFV
jgi:HEPN domain-containing protein